MSRRNSTRRRGKAKNRKVEQIEFLQEVIFHNGMAQAEGPKRKHWSKHDLLNIQPLTPRQREMFEAFFQGDQICATGSAGTGKTFIALYLALNEVLDGRFQKRIVIARSAVPTRDMGHLPGTKEEKEAPYEQPYRDMLQALCGRASTYDDMKAAGVIEFMSTSHIRGLTWDNTIILVDECQNMTWHELNSIMTRLGDNSRIIFTGDLLQTDLNKHRNDCSGMKRLIATAKRMNEFSLIEFNVEDIVRSGLVKAWIMAAEETENDH